MTAYALPDLSYDYSALEPHISVRIMELHHDKHHRAYVEGANQTVEKLAQARRGEDFGQIAGLERALAFHVSGHVLHSIFWQNLTPGGGGVPMGHLGKVIERDFGAFNALKQQMIKAAMSIMGSGWAALAWDPVSRRLETMQIHDHQSQLTLGAIPLLVIDAWEHAYYLQYQVDKARYFEALWSLWNWDDVADRYESARDVDLRLGAVVEAPPGAGVALH